VKRSLPEHIIVKWLVIRPFALRSSTSGVSPPK
jgi:hypothetical protein